MTFDEKNAQENAAEAERKRQLRHTSELGVGVEDILRDITAVNENVEENNETPASAAESIFWGASSGLDKCRHTAPSNKRALYLLSTRYQRSFFHGLTLKKLSKCISLRELAGKRRRRRRVSVSRCRPSRCKKSHARGVKRRCKNTVCERIWGSNKRI